MPTYGPDGQECPNCAWMWERIQQLNKLWHVVEALDLIEDYEYNHEQQGTWNMEQVQAIARKARETQPTQQDSKPSKGIKFETRKPCTIECDMCDGGGCSACQPSKPSCWDDCGAAGTPGAVPGDIGCDDCDMRDCQQGQKQDPAWPGATVQDVEDAYRPNGKCLPCNLSVCCPDRPWCINCPENPVGKPKGE